MCPARISGLFLALTFIGGPVLSEDNTLPLTFLESFRRGDVNDDTLVDITDAITILKVLFTGDADLSCQDKADVNDDGVLDITDPIQLLSFTFHGKDPIPEPFDQYGPDLTEDDLSPCGVQFPFPDDEEQPWLGGEVLPAEEEVIWPAPDWPSPEPCWTPWSPCI